MANKMHYGMVAEYKNPGELMHAAEKARDAGFSKFDCHSPFPIHGMDKAMGLGQSKLGWIVLGGGLTGLATGMGLQGWASTYGYPLVISGRELFSYQAFVPIAFELTILFSAFAAVFGMFALNKLPMFFHYLFYADRFKKVTDDGFFMSIDATDLKYNREHTRQFLESTHPQAIEEIEADRTAFDDLVDKVMHLKGQAEEMGKRFIPMLLCFLMVSCYQGRPSDKPPIHLIPNMDSQPKYDAQEEGVFFKNGSAQRMPVEGTVARGDLNEDDAYYRGRNASGAFLSKSPVATTMASLGRGEQRYNIYCTPCHGMTGDGRGMVVLKGYPLPPSLHDQRLLNVKDGHLFDVITNGLNNMPSYATQIPVADRWAIVQFVRALQRSQNAGISDVPEGKRAALLEEAKE